MSLRFRRTLLSIALGLGCIAGVAAIGPVQAQQTQTQTPSTPGVEDDLVPPPLDPLGGPSDPGQDDLDEAVLKRIDAETGKQLEGVAALLESALAKGLSQENQEFARKMLGSVQLQLGQGIFAAIVQGAGGNPVALRDKALEYLRSAVQNDDTQVEAYLLITQLNVLPGGDPQAAKEAATRAIEQLQDDPKKRSGVLALRSQLQEDPDDRLADLNAAIEADPNNTQAFEARVEARLQAGQVEEALADFDDAMNRDPLNLQITASVMTKLVELQRDQEAVDLLGQAIQKQTDKGTLEKLYRMRSQAYQGMGDQVKALADIDAAAALQPGDPVILLTRSRLAVSNNDLAAAKADLAKAVQIEPRVAFLPEAVLIRFFIASLEKRIPDAINEINTLIQIDGDGGQRWKAELGRLYLIDERPRQAIETFDEILAADPQDADVLRSRGDALLAVGRHDKAIDDYEQALKLLEAETGPFDQLESTDEVAEEMAGVLNNLAWVLATSPQDDDRNGERSLQLGTAAARLTDYKAAHILSTLAAAYAETGDFENARKYSSEAVKFGEADGNEQIDQLKAELENYRQEKPWREKQETQENELPILPSEDLIDI